MSFELFSRAWNQDLPTTPKMVLLALADSADTDGVCKPVIGALAKKCGMSERTVFESLRELEIAELITRQTMPGIGVQVQLWLEGPAR